MNSNEGLSFCKIKSKFEKFANDELPKYSNAQIAGVGLSSVIVSLLVIKKFKSAALFFGGMHIGYNYDYYKKIGKDTLNKYEFLK